MHCSRDLQTSFFTKTFIKSGSHSTIHTFKNYFTIVFSVFSKISIIQTDPKSTLKHYMHILIIKINKGNANEYLYGIS